MIRELISFTFDPSDALTPSYICCCCVRAAEVGEILEKASGFESTASRYLKLLTFPASIIGSVSN